MKPAQSIRDIVLPLKLMSTIQILHCGVVRTRIKLSPSEMSRFESRGE